MERSSLAIPLDQLQDLRAIVCAECRHRDGEWCKRSGLPVAVHIGGRACPKRKHPDANGFIRWAFVKWIGVPWPVRAWLSLKWWDRLYMDTPGCGCVVWLKRAWIRLRPSSQSNP